MTRPTVTVAVVDDHPLFREGVARSLSQIGGFEIVGQGGNKDDALRITGERHPDVLLMDISMPGGGLNAIGPILECHPTQKIVMLTVSEEGEDVTQALTKGARGYVSKGVGSRDLASILLTVASGERFVSPDLSARLISEFSSQSDAAANTDLLTDREREILALVASGLSNKRVGMRLNLHEKTIKHHMTRILAKLKAANRTEAAMMWRDAAERGFS